MSITTNVSKPADSALLEAYVKGLGARAKGIVAHLEFKEGEIELREGDNHWLVPRDKFAQWQERGFERTETGYPEFVHIDSVAAPQDVAVASPEGPTAPSSPPVQPKRRQRSRKGAKAPQGTSGENPPKIPDKLAVNPNAPLPDDLDKALDVLTREAYQIEVERKSGEIGALTARYKRGLLVLKLDRIKERAKAVGRKELSTRRALLRLLNSGQLLIADSWALQRFEPIEESEATMMSKVIDTFMGDDINVRFDLVDCINPLTGKPLVNDAGQPPKMPIVEIAPNKLYALIAHATEENSDKLLSFAHRYSEENIKAIARAATRLDKPISELFDEANAQRRSIESPFTEAPIEVQLDNDTLKTWLKGVTPPAAPSEFYSITTDRSWAEAIWEPLKRVLSQINDLYHFKMQSEATGDISNVFVLERTIGLYFNMHEEEGLHRTLGALIRTEDITEAQALEIMKTYTFDASSGALREMTDEEKYKASERFSGDEMSSPEEAEPTEVGATPVTEEETIPLEEDEENVEAEFEGAPFDVDLSLDSPDDEEDPENF